MLPLDWTTQAIAAFGDVARRTAIAPERFENMTSASLAVGQTPNEVVYEENKLRLRHYESRTDEQHDVPLLLVYALINRPYILDLQSDRSVVQTLLDHGLDIYLIDWGEPSSLDTSLALGDYVDRYLHNCVEVVSERADVDSINLLGYCMGGTMAAMYAALHPDRVRNLGLMAAPLDVDGTGGVLERWGKEDVYDPEELAETFGNVPAEFLDAGFVAMDPVENTVTTYVHLYDRFDDESHVENFARVERWLRDGVDVAGEAYAQFVEDIYQKNKLVKNEMAIAGEHVNVENITMPVLQIVGTHDYLVPVEASLPFGDAIPSDDVTVLESPSGHVGISISPRAHEQLWPEVSEWFRERG